MVKDIDNFKFFIPLDIEKSKDKKGNKIMKIKGTASTIDEDSDKETLDPAGFDLSFFKKNGFINWHHTWKDKPSAVIGEPTLAEIRNNEFYLEGILYPDSKLAEEVYDLAENLEKNSQSGRRLGFSIEGQATERGSNDENNPLFKYVKKAKITGVAITPTPKNSATLVDIMKGNFVEFEAENEPQLKANGGSTYIIDITKPNGERITVDNDYKIKVISKGADTTNSRALIPEDVEGDLKKLQENTKNEENNLKDNKKNPKFVTLNKSILFDEILKATDSFILTKEIVNSINFNNMNKPEIKIDELVKALQEIGVTVDPSKLLSKAEENTNTTEENDTNKESVAKPEETEIEKAIKTKEQELEVLKADLNKAKESEKDDDDKDKDKDSKKVENNTLLDKKEDKKEGEKDNDELEKDKSKKSEMKKGSDNELETLKSDLTKAIGENNGELVKGLSDMASLFKSFAENMNERLTTIENQSTGRKSLQNTKIIEKSFGSPEDKSNEGKTKFSISQNRQQISNILLSKSGIEKGEPNDFYCNAATSFEASGELSKAVVTDLFVNHNILITK
jgi:hypothetical protein